MEKIKLIFDGDESCRLDMFVAQKTDISRSRVTKLAEEGAITVDGKVANKKQKLKSGDEIEIEIPKAAEYKAEPQDIPLDIVFEDGDVLVVNKPKGMVVHPANGNFDNTLVNAVMFHCKESLSGINGVLRPGIVHRIDKNTSGLLMIAKNDTAHICLSNQIKEHSFEREYEAVVYGNIKENSGTVEAPIGRHPVKRKQMAVTEKNSKDAKTHFKVLERFGNFTHIRLKLETGRTHQIRVHMAYIGHPVAGDDVYGPKNVISYLGGQCLHAKKLGFTHPNGKKMEFESDLPDYFKDFLNRCSKGNV
ncbi:MAG: RluA family pseudouridine synthase [Clostridia bacterium]|nr:RluA family pseudouridine synthase [Clostridia bacterium]